MSDLRKLLEKEAGQKLPESFADLVDELRPEDTTGENLDLLKNLAVVAGGLGSIFLSGFDFNRMASLTGFFGLNVDKTFNLAKSALGFKDWALDLSVIERYKKLKQHHIILGYYSAFKALEILEPEIQETKKELQGDKDFEKLILEKAILSFRNRDDNIYSQNAQFSMSGGIHISKVNISGLQQKFIDEQMCAFNAFRTYLAKEIPEYGLFLSQESHDQIKKYFPIIQGLEPLADSLLALNGLKELDADFPDVKIYPQLTPLELIGKDEEHREIKSYLGKIKSFQEKKLFRAEEVKEAESPTAAAAYVPQAYESIVYNAEIHQDFFEKSKWDKLGKTTGPKVSYPLYKALLNPENSLKPILLLGNPGSGKSMASRLLAAKLLEQPGFIPFWIPLKKVDSNHVEIKDHINQGIKHLLDDNMEVHWKNWVKAFPERIPVFILDGLDELLQTSETDLHGYLIKVRDLQESILKDGISARFIVTSRLTVMDRLNIPNGVEIFKLSSFNRPKQELWCQRWNKIQEKAGKATFTLPEETIEQNGNLIHNDVPTTELAKEPLILFLLALYNSGGGSLKNLSESGGRSRLYDELIQQFTLRQILKGKKFDGFTIHNPPDTKEFKDQCEGFRLTLGVAAFLMYRLDRTDLKPRELKDGTDYFKVPIGVDSKDFFRGFFFLHTSDSQGKEDEQKWNFEFIHKTFGEFLAADFIYKVSQAQGGEDFISPSLGDENSFRVVLGYQWLTKHPKILYFLREITSNGKLEQSTKKIILKTIKKELKRFQSQEEWPFPVSDFLMGGHYTKIEHFARYSQNLILLWFGLEGEEKLEFTLFEGEENKLLETPAVEMSRSMSHEGEIADNVLPQGKNLLFWQQIAQLWKLIGGNSNLRDFSYQGEAKHQAGVVTFEAHDGFGSMGAAQLSQLLDYDLVKDSSIGLRGSDYVKLLKRSPENTRDILKLFYRVSWNYFLPSFIKQIWEVLYPQWLRKFLEKSPDLWSAVLKEDRRLLGFFNEGKLEGSDRTLFFDFLHYDCFKNEALDTVLSVYQKAIKGRSQHHVLDLVELCRLQARHPEHKEFTGPWFGLGRIESKKRDTTVYINSAIYLDAYGALSPIAGPLLCSIDLRYGETALNFGPLKIQQFKNLYARYHAEITEYEKILAQKKGTDTI